MDALHIRHLEASYHLPPSRVEDKRRLDEVLDKVMEVALEAALERLGVTQEEEICIRHIHVPLRLRLASPDRELCLAWSLALAEAIQQALAEGGDGDVVRYASERQALVDFALGVATGDLRRSWAWKQMGFGDATTVSLMGTAVLGSPDRAALELLAALAKAPSSIVGVLGAVVAEGRLAALARRLPDEAWPALARQALAAAGVATTGWFQRQDSEPASVASVASVVERIQRSLAASVIFRGATQRVPGLLEKPDVRMALTLLSLLEVERGVFYRPVPEARQLACKAALELTLQSRAQAPPSTPDAAVAEVSFERRRDAAASLSEQRDADPTEVEDSSMAPRARGFTRAGGVLFLLGILDDLKLPREMVGGLRRRSLSWLLHRLAMTLADVEEEDPATLAFAGLGPDAEPPSVGEDPPLPLELQLLADWRERVAAVLRQRLGLEEMSTPQLLHRVCRRRASLVADPGWIEVHLDLREVSTEIRRAGLDLDPGYLPWLGAVVKFIYR